MSLSVRPLVIRSAAVLGVLGAVVFLWACNNPTGGNGCDSTGANIIINAQDNLTFDQTSVTISKGQKVCWQNFGTITHSVTADPSLADSTWNIDETLAPNLVVLYTFGVVGDFAYHCRYHVANNMRGVVHVR